MKNLSVKEINSVLLNEEQECKKENILTDEEILEYLVIIEYEITKCWTSIDYVNYWMNVCKEKKWPIRSN